MKNSNLVTSPASTGTTFIKCKTVSYCGVFLLRIVYKLEEKINYIISYIFFHVDLLSQKYKTFYPKTLKTNYQYVLVGNSIVKLCKLSVLSSE